MKVFWKRGERVDLSIFHIQSFWEALLIERWRCTHQYIMLMYSFHPYSPISSSIPWTIMCISTPQTPSIFDSYWMRSMRHLRILNAKIESNFGPKLLISSNHTIHIPSGACGSGLIEEFTMGQIYIVDLKGRGCMKENLEKREISQMDETPMSGKLLVWERKLSCGIST